MAKTTIMLKADTKQRKASKVKHNIMSEATAEEVQERYIAACEALRDAIHAMAPGMSKKTMRSLDDAISEQFERLDEIVLDVVCM